jgi:hypothetical protein
MQEDGVKFTPNVSISQIPNSESEERVSDLQLQTTTPRRISDVIQINEDGAQPYLEQDGAQESVAEVESFFSYQRLLFDMAVQASDATSSEDRLSSNSISGGQNNPMAEFNNPKMLRKHASPHDAPSRSSLSVVEPLHFLPATANLENADLFNICWYIPPNHSSITKCFVLSCQSYN